MNYKSKWLILITVICFACNPSFDEKISDLIKESCKNYDVGGCTFKLSEVTDFEWDRVYIIGELSYPDEINEVLGFDCACDVVPDNYNRILFINSNEVVYSEDYHSLAAIQFREVDSSKQEVINYQVEEADFIVLKKQEVDGRVFFDLYPQKGYLEPKYIENRAD